MMFRGSGWTTVSLGTVLPIQYGKAMSKTARAPVGTVPVVGSSGVIGMHNEAYTLGPTLVIGRKGNVGSVHYISKPCWPIDTAFFAVGTPSSFLPYFAHLLRFLNLARFDKSTAIPGLSRDDYDSVEVPLAPLPEQHRIVEAIDSYFSRLEDAVATMERVQRNLKRYSASILKSAVEGRLVPTEAELARAEGRAYEPASVLLERILAERRRLWEEAELAKMHASRKAPKNDNWKTKYKEPLAPDTTDLPEPPEGWCWATMDQLTSRITSGSRDWTRYYGRGDSVFLMAQNVRPGQLDLTHKQVVDPPAHDASCERTQVLPADLLVTIVGANTGNVCRVATALPRHYVCQSVALMRPVASFVSSYLDAYLNSPLGQHVYAGYVYGQGRPHLSFDALKETPVPLPPSIEQTRIVESFERTQTVVAAAIYQLSKSTKRCDRLRQSILKGAFEGRLVHQDPTDEPASALLERIRAERAVAAERTKRVASRKPRTKTA